MSNALFKTTLASFLLLSAGAAMADAPSAVDLAVQGKIIAPGCSVLAQNNGDYDYGSIPGTTIRPGTATTALQPMTQTWTVSCDGPTFLTYTLIDNEAASNSVPGDTTFGLGNVNGTGKIGYYTLGISNGMVDGSTSYLFGNPGGSYTSLNPISGSAPHGWATTLVDSNPTQRAGQVFAVDITVSPVLAGSTTMNGPLTDAVPLNGSITINYAFGL